MLQVPQRQLPRLQDGRSADHEAIGRVTVGWRVQPMRHGEVEEEHIARAHVCLVAR